jgi:hypothetical protein
MNTALHHAPLQCNTICAGGGGWLPWSQCFGEGRYRSCVLVSVEKLVVQTTLVK